MLGGYRRIRFACRPRAAVDATTGARVTAHQAKLLGLLDTDDPSMVSELAEHAGVTEAGARLRDARPLLDPQRVDGMLRMLDPERRREALRGLGLLADAADAYLARGQEHLEALVTVEEA